MVLKLPKANYKPRTIPKKNEVEKKPKEQNTTFLEVDDNIDDMDFSKIVENNKKKKTFCDNPEVPPLEYCY